MTDIHLGEFYNVAGARLSEHGLSVWDHTDMEFFLELVFPDPTPLEGAFGEPPEEGGFQYLEGLKIPAVRKVEILPCSVHDTFEVRTLRVTTKTAGLKWDLYLPRRSQT